MSWEEVAKSPEPSVMEDPTLETDAAYILYTSGSTGKPKGVTISHRNSLTFVDWAAEYVGLTANDRVSSPAPLNFDLSTFEIFSSVRAGATIILIPDNTMTFPVQITKLIERERITVWYSVPSALTLLVLYGGLAEHDLSCLRTVIFAGEVFPVKYLRKLMDLVPHARYLNWYGPTETNDGLRTRCRLEPKRNVPIPIGKACANTNVFAVDSKGKKITKTGELGELYVRGPSLMKGYWGDSKRSADVLVLNPLQSQFAQELVYKTGDLTALDGDGNYLYMGREDGMIKTRGYRVELGEIESVLYSNSVIKEAVVLPIPDEILGNRLLAVIIPLEPGGQLTREKVLAFCNQKLPHYMVPDMIEFRDILPKTLTGKTDRLRLAQNFAASISSSR